MTRIGYVLILLAMVVYALAALFLDYNPSMGPGDSGISLFEVLTFAPGMGGALVVIGGTLTAFGGPLLIAVLALLGLRARPYSPARSTVMLVVATWSTVVVGSTFQLLGAEFLLGAGFWVQTACAGVAILGALMLLNRTGARPPRAGIASE